MSSRRRYWAAAVAMASALASIRTKKRFEEPDSESAAITTNSADDSDPHDASRFPPHEAVPSCLENPCGAQEERAL